MLHQRRQWLVWWIQAEVAFSWPQVHGHVKMQLADAIPSQVQQLLGCTVTDAVAIARIGGAACAVRGLDAQPPRFRLWGNFGICSAHPSLPACPDAAQRSSEGSRLNALAAAQQLLDTDFKGAGGGMRLWLCKASINLGLVVRPCSSDIVQHIHPDDGTPPSETLLHGVPPMNRGCKHICCCTSRARHRQLQ